MIDRNEYERRKDALRQQISDWGQVRSLAESNVKTLQGELSDLQDAYIDSLKDHT